MIDKTMDGHKGSRHHIECFIYYLKLYFLFSFFITHLLMLLFLLLLLLLPYNLILLMYLNQQHFAEIKA